MSLDIVQVDAFSDRAFTGNPAAVCILRDGSVLQDWQMQEVAREMNLSETAFVLPHGDGFDLRWFTPLVEVDLCGHATLAAAHVIWEDERLPPEVPARFHTRSGVLTAFREGNWVELDFPADPVEQVDPPEVLERAFGVRPLWVGRGRHDLLVELPDEKAVRTLQPNFPVLATVDARGTIVTSRAVADQFDFVSRFFAPRVGIPEDPVTGSAHCTLGPFWSDRLGRDTLVGYQVSDRGGTVRVAVDRGDRVLLAGQAVTVMRGTIFV
ncbi:MAG: PhzF family phenazine biosynthesis isomerase [Gemmatimonas sp.]|nr:PhzF family phenazine biosynthesis isomerase [Gemmatimonas sp.]